MIDHTPGAMLGEVPAQPSAPCVAATIVDADTLLGAIMLEAYSLKSYVGGLEHFAHIVPHRTLVGMAWLQHWTSTDGVVSGMIRTLRPVPVVEAAQYIREHISNWADAAVVRWPHPGCGVDPFAAELALTNYWSAGEGAH